MVEQHWACPNGHQVDGSFAFCPACGEPRAAAANDPAEPEGLEQEGLEQDRLNQDSTATDASEEQASEPATAERPRWWTRTGILATAGVAVLVIVLVAVFASRGNKEDETDQREATLDPHTICVNQLIAMTTNMHDNTETGQLSEIQINGTSDPFLPFARELYANYVSGAFNIGAEAAANRILEEADRICTYELDDAVRPNYPTDGTYPVF